MGTVVCDITVSVDGFAAGPNQRREAPLGDRGEELHRWMFEAPDESRTEIDGILGHGAFIMGRNMFGPPRRGDWQAPWRGWWGPEPPYRAPVYVLTHTAQPPIEMEGGTSFRFVADGIASALTQARAAAAGGSVAVAGGASAVDQFLAAGLIDELRLHIAPIVLGAGERLFAASGPVRLQPIRSRATPLVTHLTYRALSESLS